MKKKKKPPNAEAVSKAGAERSAPALAVTHENAGTLHFVPDNGDHILGANCDCKPVLVNGVLVHNALADTGYSR